MTTEYIKTEFEKEFNISVKCVSKIAFDCYMVETTDGVTYKIKF